MGYKPGGPTLAEIVYEISNQLDFQLISDFKLDFQLISDFKLDF